MFQRASATRIVGVPGEAPSATAEYMTAVAATMNAAIRCRKSSQSYTAANLMGPLGGMRSGEQGAQVAFEPRIGHRGGVHADHLDPLARSEAGHGAEHGHAVLAARVDHSAGQGRAVAPDDEAVVRRLDVGPQAAQAFDHACYAIRFLDAQLAGSATRVSSSIAVGTSAGSTTVPSSGAEATSSSPTGSSSASVPGSSRSPRITAPIRSAMRKKPVRVQFRSTPFTTTREPATSVAAAATKAADEGSPGTTISSSSSSSTCETVSREPSRSNGTRARL